MRLRYLSLYSDPTEFKFGTGKIGLWSVIEEGIGIFAGSLPESQLFDVSYPYHSSGPFSVTAGIPLRMGTNTTSREQEGTEQIVDQMLCWIHSRNCQIKMEKGTEMATARNIF